MIPSLRRRTVCHDLDDVFTRLFALTAALRCDISVSRVVKAVGVDVLSGTDQVSVCFSE